MLHDEESNFDPSEFFLHKGGSASDNVLQNRDSYVFRGIGSLNIKDAINAPFTIVGNDQFFQHLYEYHQGSGLVCIFLNEICYILTVLFTILFSTFLTTCVDWKSIHDGKNTTLHDAIYPGCSPDGGRNGMVTLAFLVFIIYWFILAGRTTLYLLRIKKVHDLWIGVLGLSSDVQWVTWQMVIDAYHERIDQSVDSHYIVNRIMRWDNYLIAMLMKNVFGMNYFNGVFTKVLEWNIERCISSALFRDDGILIKDVMLQSKKSEYVVRLRKTFLFYGVMNLICLPFVFSALLVYFIYRYVSEYHKNPRAMGLYSFTPIAKLKLRDFNELQHVYVARLNRAHPKIIEYLSQFVNEGVNIIFKFISFLLGSTLLILVAVSFFYPDIIISLFLTEKPIIFYVGVLGILFAAVQNSTVTDPIVYEPDEKFDELMRVLHGTPTSWAHMSTRERYMEIRKFFKYKWMVWVYEILSVIYVPFLLLFYLPTKSEDIVDFFRENSIHVDKLGIICSCASFGVHKPLIHTSEDQDDDVDSVTSSMERKMSTSVLNFKQNYTWEPEKFRRTGVTSHIINQEYEERLRLLRIQREQRERQEALITHESYSHSHSPSHSHSHSHSQNHQQHQQQPRSALSDGLSHYTDALEESVPQTQTQQNRSESYGSNRSRELNASLIINQMNMYEDQQQHQMHEQQQQQQQQYQQQQNEQSDSSSSLSTPSSSVPLDINIPFPLNLTD